MADTAKSWNRREPCLPSYRELYTDGAPTGTVQQRTPQMLGPSGTATCLRHRPRPNPLTLTPLTVNETTRISGGCGDIYDNLYLGRSFWRNYGTFFQNRGYGSVTKLETSTGDGQSALTKAASYRDASFGEAFAELGQTQRMILKRLSDLNRLFSAIRSGGFHRLLPKGRKPLSGKDLSNHFLEYQYGWQPLMQDVYDGLKVYNQGLSTRGGKVTRKSSHLGQATPSGYQARGRAGYKGTITNSGLYDLNRLGLLNPAELAWEKLPLSFVADWFLPIGRTLGALTYSAGLDVHSIWYVTETLTVTIRNSADASNQQRPEQVVKGVQRSVGVVIIPVFYRNYAPLLAGQIASAVALVRQRLR